MDEVVEAHLPELQLTTEEVVRSSDPTQQRIQNPSSTISHHREPLHRSSHVSWKSHLRADYAYCVTTVLRLNSSLKAGVCLARSLHQTSLKAACLVSLNGQGSSR